MRFYEDFLSSLRRGCERGFDFSLRHFWYTCFLGLCIAATALSLIAAFVRERALEMSQPKVYRINQWQK